MCGSLGHFRDLAYGVLLGRKRLPRCLIKG